MGGEERERKWFRMFLNLSSKILFNVAHCNRWVSQSVKNLLAMQETWVQSLVWEDPLEKEMATHSSILVWEISRTEEPGKQQALGSQKLNMT